MGTADGDHPPGPGSFAGHPERLLGLGLQAVAPPSSAELAAALEYQLVSPLEFDLGGIDDTDQRRLRGRITGQGLLLKSLHDLFEHRQPPLELLVMTKDFAKSSLTASDSPLPKPVAAVIYYLSIGIALARLGRRISTLSDTGLRHGIDWALAQPWVDESSRRILNSTRRTLLRQSPSPTCDGASAS